MDDLKQRLTNCFSTVFPELSEEEIHRASQEKVSSWDSIAAITLVNVIEDEFETQLDLDVLPELTSFDLVLNHVESVCKQ
jgi:acyl carrier protein